MPEGGEGDEPADEDECRARPGVVRSRQAPVEPCECRGRASASARAGSSVFLPPRSPSPSVRRRPARRAVDPRRARREQAAVAGADDRDRVADDVVVRAGRGQRDVDRRLGRLLASCRTTSPSRPTSDETTRPADERGERPLAGYGRAGAGDEQPDRTAACVRRRSNGGTTMTATERGGVAACGRRRRDSDGGDQGEHEAGGS